MVATSTSWKHASFQEGKPIPYRRIFSDAEFDRLRQGLIPLEMEDKWFIHFEDPYLFFHRSWTGDAVYRLKLSRTVEGVQASEALTNKNLPENSNLDRLYQAPLLDFLISNLLLGESKPFPIPSDIEDSLRGGYQHAVSGTAFPCHAG